MDDPSSSNAEVCISTEALTRVLFRLALCKLSVQLCTVAARLLQRTFGAEWKAQAVDSLKETNLAQKLEKVEDGTLDLYYVTEILKHFHTEFARQLCSSGGLRDFKAMYDACVAFLGEKG